jgi:hypothetical protein
MTDEFEAGDAITHRSFGRGEIVRKQRPLVDNCRYEVLFPSIPFPLFCKAVEMTRVSELQQLAEVGTDWKP